MQKRRKQLIDPRLQTKFILAFVCVAGSCLLLQSVTVVLSLHRLADRLPHDGPLVLDEIGSTLGFNLGLLFLFLVPLSVAVSTILTFRIAGPIYRFRMFLESLTRGERPADCRIRTGDELQDFCELLNRATEPLRQPVAVPASTPEGASAERRRSA